MKILSRVWHWRLPDGMTRWLCAAGILLAVAAIVWLCTYKIMDRDFWWHITAGNIMWHTHRIIRIDPFAFTRAGLPYLATHEWLAQMILTAVFRLGGTTGIILFRSVIACATMGLLLLLAPRKLFPNILLAVWAVVITKGSWLERPQLFTFVLFAAFLLLAFRFLDAATIRKRLWICAALVVLELLWVNMHGAAALLGCAVASFLFAQAAVLWWKSRTKENRSVVILLGGTLVLMAAVLVSPPNGFGTIRYLQSLLHDQTILYIAEWRPSDWPAYIAGLWPFWLCALAALAAGRRHLIFNVLLLCMTAYLSRQAVRHEILFIIAALATTFYQLDRSGLADRIGEWAAKRSGAVALLLLAAALILGKVAYTRTVDFEQPDNLFGFGAFDLARGAYDFVTRENITGNMFNTYGIGGYLIYRGFPDRKVFIDGRNVDYGMDFMTHAYAAGIDPKEWNALADRYSINYALIDYDAIRQQNRLPYSNILDRNPLWSLVYLDDWVAVYVRNSPANQPLIRQWHYSLLSATDLQFKGGFEDMPESSLPALIAELQHMRQENPEGVKASLALAKIAIRQGKFDEAKTLAEEVKKLRPYAPEPFAILGALYVNGQQWKEAADAYGNLLRLAGNRYPDLNERYIADVYEKAGRTWAAWYLRLNTRTPAAQPATGTGSAVASTGSLAINPAQDAQMFNDQGVTQAENRQYAEAEQSLLSALKINPGFAEAWNNLCALHLSQKRTADAIDACTHAVAANASFADAHFNLALAYYRDGAKAKAEREALLAKKSGRIKESDDLLLLIRKMKL